MRGRIRTAALLAGAGILTPGAAADGEADPAAPPPIPLRVAVIDGVTGVPLEGAVLGLGTAAANPVPLLAEGTGHLLEDSGILPGSRIVRLSAELPKGWLLDPFHRTDFPTQVTRFTKSLAATVVAWPEARIRVRVVNGTGEPVPGAFLSASVDGYFRVGDLGLSVASGNWMTSESLGEGRTVASGFADLGGIPCIPGETLTVHAVSDTMVGASVPFVLLGDGLLHEVLVEARDRGEDFDPIGVGGSAGIFCGSRFGSGKPPRGQGRLEVEVRRHDGDPARDTVVILTGWGDAPGGGRSPWSREALTDGNGLAVFEALRADMVRVRVREPGFLSGNPVPVEVLRGEIVRVLLEEAPAGSLTVHAVDETGRSLPGAVLGVFVPGLYAALEDDDAQNLSLVTGPDGLCLVPRLPEGRVRIVARRGTAEGSAETQGRDHPLVVVLRREGEEDAGR